MSRSEKRSAFYAIEKHGYRCGAIRSVFRSLSCICWTHERGYIDKSVFSLNCRCRYLLSVPHCPVLFRTLLQTFQTQLGRETATQAGFVCSLPSGPGVPPTHLLNGTPIWASTPGFSYPTNGRPQPRQPFRANIDFHICPLSLAAWHPALWRRSLPCLARWHSTVIRLSRSWQQLPVRSASPSWRYAER